MNNMNWNGRNLAKSLAVMGQGNRTVIIGDIGVKSDRFGKDLIYKTKYKTKHKLV